MADNQDPLASLQQLLQDQKTSGANPDANSDAAPIADSGAEAPVQEEAIQAQPGPSAEEIAILQKNKQAEDEVKIQEQLDKMQTELKDTPQYQARVSQKEFSEADAEKKRLEERSKQIFQLRHLDP